MLSIVRLTSARPSAGRLAVPAKMTSSIFWLRTALGACAPSTQAMASTTLDLPLPFGPDDHGDPGLEGEHGRLGEGLEALEGQLAQEHGERREYLRPPVGPRSLEPSATRLR